MARSTPSSSPLATPLVIRSASTGLLLPHRALQCPPDQFLSRVCTGTGRLQQACRLRRTVSEGDERTVCLALRARAGAHCEGTGGGLGTRDAIAHLHDQALRRLTANTRH